ncbi:2-hydroxyacid dehydrogenase [Montanilutibacter psychrotolerans]|uniref:Hydroxyacid dehydrogenase n=1 Tax=Montanilutibacter psychrotolerans TaxID=1327343 RepID=A0A3M8SYJ0_9GAMM|nr:NAD(P)-dependent oxidoreductase [Lysobacter psychrotolerans]RNF83622.1 hydroxyacid dehydrogenase [Lysobacter psychrotolerans]
MAGTHTITMTVLSARGRETFSTAQLDALEAVAQLHVERVPERLPDADLVALCAGADVVGLSRRATQDVHAGIIAALPRLRGLAIHATGREWVDEEALHDGDILLASLPGYATRVVAEHTLGLLLSMSRRLHLSDRRARGEFGSDISLRGWELHGRTLGIIGMGRIGSEVARLAGAFGMRVVYFDTQAVTTTAAESLPLDAVLATADVVVLACSLQRGRPAWFDADLIARMRPGAVLLNPARPGLVDNGAVLAGVARGHLAGYAVDDSVFDAQQLASVEHGRILQSAHTAWYSDEAIAAGIEAWTQELLALATVLQSRPLPAEAG